MCTASATTMSALARQISAPTRGVAQVLHTNAFRSAPVAVLAPFEYSAMLWAVVAGYLVWNDLPTWWTGAGTTLIVLSGLYILHREIVVGRRRRLGKA